MFCIAVSEVSYLLLRPGRVLPHLEDGLPYHSQRRSRHLALHDRPASGLFRFEAHPALVDKFIETCTDVVAMTCIWCQDRRVARKGLVRGSKTSLRLGLARS